MTNLSHFKFRLFYSKIFRNVFSSIVIRNSRYYSNNISSISIRQTFLDYYVKEKQHVFIKSSPVVPFFDSTVPFVNAGMNQFKNIFLGTQIPHFTRVANSQKCIRIAGKHNDIDIVGKDGYHHTFFEMLGNWSFCGDYSKAEACKMAWELLTQIYNISSSQLYVTYFGGDESLGLIADLETKEIWKSLGVCKSRILKCGVNDNFWEMGLLGPCGPSTEIHYDFKGTVNRSSLVNKGFNDLLEIWNIVFIEYNRFEDNNFGLSLESLPKKHIDTGMGLERIVCLLQNKQSTYDTDLFDYLIAAIEKNCNVSKYSGTFDKSNLINLDTCYRILSDHIRTIVVALADGVIPEENQKLRRIMRKCFTISEKVFKHQNGFIKLLSNYVVDNLGQIYPEMKKNIHQIHQIIDFEEEIFRLLRRTAEKELTKLNDLNLNNSLAFDSTLDLTPSFILAYKEIKHLNVTEIDGNMAYKLYDTYGLDSNAIQQLAKLFNLNFNSNMFRQYREKIKLNSKLNQYQNAQIDLNNLLFRNLNAAKVELTNDSTKYSYFKNDILQSYTFPDQVAKVLEIVDNESNNGYYSLILDKTNFYSEAGGQESDTGIIRLNDENIFNIESIKNLNGYILHNIRLTNNNNNNGNYPRVGDEIILQVNAKHRFNCMRNHTCLHLLNAALKKIKIATCQKSSKITSSYFNLDVAIFGTKLTIDDIINIEDIILNLIRSKINVKCIITDSQDIYNEFDHITFVPGEIYPVNNIRIIEIIDKNTGFISREPCCGTHVINTADIEDFCIISMKSLGSSTVSLHAVNGQRAKMAKKNADILFKDVLNLKKSIATIDAIDNDDDINDFNTTNSRLGHLKYRLQYDIMDESILPLTSKDYILNELNQIENDLTKIGKRKLKELIDAEIAEALKSNIRHTKVNKIPYLIYNLKNSIVSESVSLQKVIKKCPNIPLIIITNSNNSVKAKCCVPKEFQCDNFSAEKWLQTVGRIFQSNVAPPKGQNPNYVCNLKGKKIASENWDKLLDESLTQANEYIKKYLL